MPIALSLDELIALNDEIAALVRAGVPLDTGLRSLGGELPGRLGRLARSLSERLERGESLVQALDDTGGGFPRAYRAVVAAGLRSGRLAAALEGLSTAARRANELRRVMIVSLIYPVVVLMVASLLFLFTALKTAPIVAEVYEQLGFDPPWWYQRLQDLLQFSPQLMAALWVLGLLVGGIWLYRASRASTLASSSVRGAPSVSRILHLGRMAMFADVLALMIDQQVPLDEAVTLAGESSGDRMLTQATRTLAEQVRGGGRQLQQTSGVPPLLAWLITSGTRAEHLAHSLRQTADSYRRRALNLGTWLTVYLPILLSAGMGGLVALFFTLVIMLPFCNLLFRLSAP